MRHIGLVALIGTIGLSLAAGPWQAAGATPIDDARAKAAAIQSQIEANGHQLDALGERYDGAVLALQSAEQAVADSSARIAATRAEVRKTRSLVDERAASVYRSAVSGASLDLLDFDNAQRLLTRNRYAAAQASRDDALLGHLTDVQEQLSAQKAAAERDRADAEAQRQQIASAKSQIEAANAQEQQLLSQVQGQLAQLVAQEQARRAAAALAAARARFSPGVRAADNGNPEAFPNLPPNGPVAAAAIAFARAQLGKPYLYAAAGPDRYDCSGLVMAAFRAAGVSLPHYSGAQYQMLPHVALDNVQVGDLMFWGSGGSEHVAIYVGDGRILEAGGSAHIVHIGPIWGHPIGAARVPEG